MRQNMHIYKLCDVGQQAKVEAVLKCLKKNREKYKE